MNHRPRQFGVSKYGAMNRAFRGLADCFAVRWMGMRMLNYDVREDTGGGAPAPEEDGQEGHGDDASLVVVTHTATDSALQGVVEQLRGAGTVTGRSMFGGYGIYQFFFLAPWDAFWMRVVQMDSIGRPAPFEVRIFGTLNSPGPYADMLAASLLVALGASGRLPWLAGMPAVVALLLSLVRAAWVGYAAGLFLLLARMDMSKRAKLIAVLDSGPGAFLRQLEITPNG